MFRATVLILALLATLPLAASDRGAAPTESAVPQSYAWIAMPCANWTCAASEMVLASGDPSVLVVAMPGGDHPWVILRRVRTGSFHVPDDAAIKIDSFDSLSLATTRFDSLSEHAPTLLTVRDGLSLVVYTTKKSTAGAAVIRRQR